MFFVGDSWAISQTNKIRNALVQCGFGDLSSEHLEWAWAVHSLYYLVDMSKVWPSGHDLYYLNYVFVIYIIYIFLPLRSTATVKSTFIL